MIRGQNWQRRSALFAARELIVLARETNDYAQYLQTLEEIAKSLEWDFITENGGGRKVPSGVRAK